MNLWATAIFMWGPLLAGMVAGYLALGLVARLIAGRRTGAQPAG